MIDSNFVIVHLFNVTDQGDEQGSITLSSSIFKISLKMFLLNGSNLSVVALKLDCGCQCLYNGPLRLLVPHLV